VRIYLNVSCLNRPFDDQEQSRIRLEAAAVGMIFEGFDEGQWVHVSSEIAQIEIAAIPDPERRERVNLLLPEVSRIVMLGPAHFVRGKELESLGFKAADALHIAGAEDAAADVLLSCDDRFCRTAERQSKRLGVRVCNPLTWLEEVEHAADST
jgi:hypothetical protein